MSVSFSIIHNDIIFVMAAGLRFMSIGREVFPGKCHQLILYRVSWPFILTPSSGATNKNLLSKDDCNLQVHCKI